MDLWSGLACLKPKPDVKGFRMFGSGRGAYVHVVAWAESSRSFEEQVRKPAENLDCILVELEDIELLETKMGSPDSPEEFINMRETAIRQPQDIPFLGPFIFGAKRMQTEG
jgi:hypothetical protein